MFPMRYTKGPSIDISEKYKYHATSVKGQNPRCVRVSGDTIFVASYGLDGLVRIEDAVIM
jgi:hypothetical protein